MVDFGQGLVITPWHPVLDGQEWRFPCEIKTPSQVKVGKYFNFVLDSRHVVDIGSKLVCTLGHGFEGPIISHEFYGTERVLEVLKMFKGWEQGLVVLEGEHTLAEEEEKSRGSSHTGRSCCSEEVGQEWTSQLSWVNNY
eukprot:TRINITY_DN748_c0_g1_i2.p1 TRINITY_DN748_c0_g1~~TRINITY_DN748_c0_g1_i2.p1  ORF type:complete len:139 (-),score=41.09 TRINITY_DN748_c0_g1_i2:40-456(-)